MCHCGNLTCDPIVILNANRAGDVLKHMDLIFRTECHAPLAKIKYTGTIRLLIDAKWITTQQQQKAASAFRL
jgi:hypothetical protein